MNCKKCGKRIGPDDLYCPDCGTPCGKGRAEDYFRPAEDPVLTDRTGPDKEEPRTEKQEKEWFCPVDLETDGQSTKSGTGGKEGKGFAPVVLKPGGTVGKGDSGWFGVPGDLTEGGHTGGGTTDHGGSGHTGGGTTGHGGRGGTGGYTPPSRWKGWMTAAACIVLLCLCAVVISAITNHAPSGDEKLKGNRGSWTADTKPAGDPLSRNREDDYIESNSYQEFTGYLNDLTEKYADESSEDEYALCRLIVSCDDRVDVTSWGASEVLRSPDGIYVLQFDNARDAENACRELSSAVGVEYAEPDVMLTADNNAASRAKPISWGTTDIGADLFAEALEQNGYQAVTVAVVDSGVSAHEMLDARLLKGWDFQDNDANASDPNGHGTHVSGTVVDATPNLDIRILPVRVLNKRGKGSSLVVASGIRYAADSEADVINLSLGGGHSEYMDDAIAYALARNITVVCSSGNASADTSDYCPAHVDSVVTVSAVDSSYNFASFSNYGAAVDFCAPGVGIYSCVPGGYQYKEGTSMAAPYISALAAMLRASGIAQTPEQVKDTLVSCARDLGDAGKDDRFGHGLPQMVQLVHSLYGNPEYTMAIEAYGKTLSSGVLLEIGSGEQFYPTHYELLDMNEDGIPEMVVYAVYDDVPAFKIYTCSGGEVRQIADSLATCDISEWFNAEHNVHIYNGKNVYVSAEMVTASYSDGTSGLLVYDGSKVTKEPASWQQDNKKELISGSTIAGGVKIGSADDFLTAPYGGAPTGVPATPGAPAPAPTPDPAPDPAPAPAVTEPQDPSGDTLEDGTYYGLLTAWDRHFMSVEMLTFQGFLQPSGNYDLASTGVYRTLNTASSSVWLEWPWGTSGSDILCGSIDEALDTEPEGWGSTVRENCTMEICFTVKDNLVEKIVILYTA